MNRKPRSDSKLAKLSGAQAEQLWAWMRSGASYKTIVELVKSEFQVETSTRALSEWWEDRAELEAREQILRATNLADRVGKELGEKLPEMTKALQGQLTQKAFELGMTGADPKHIEQVMNIVGGIAKAELERAKVEIDTAKLHQRIREYEEKTAAAKKVLEGVKTGGGLTPEARAKIEEAAGLL